MSTVKVTFVGSGSVQIGSTPANIVTYAGEPGDELEVPSGVTVALAAAGLIAPLEKPKRGRKSSAKGDGSSKGEAGDTAKGEGDGSDDDAKGEAEGEASSE